MLRIVTSQDLVITVRDVILSCEKFSPENESTFNFIVFYFLEASNAAITSSIPDLYMKKFSGTSSISPSIIFLKPATVSDSLAYTHGVPVNCSATKKG